MRLSACWLLKVSLRPSGIGIAVSIFGSDPLRLPLSRVLSLNTNHHQLIPAVPCRKDKGRLYLKDLLNFIKFYYLGRNHNFLLLLCIHEICYPSSASTKDLLIKYQQFGLSSGIKNENKMFAFSSKLKVIIEIHFSQYYSIFFDSMVLFV